MSSHHCSNYIVIPSLHIGGAEKRFVDIFKGMRAAEENVSLVISSSLLNVLGDALKDFMDAVVIIQQESDSHVEFVRNYAKWLWPLRKHRLNIHYAINPLFFLHFFTPHSLSMTVTECRYPPTFWTTHRSRIRVYISMWFCNKIDVLNPDVFGAILTQKISRWRNVTQTPNGTYVFPNQLSGPTSKKRPEIGMMTRLWPFKGIDLFLDGLTDIWDRIKDTVPNETKFFIAGDGPEQGTVEFKVNAAFGHGVPIEFLGFRTSDEILQNACIILSLSTHTNFPSRVVAESLLSGASVIITKTGDSEEFGEMSPGIHYVDPDFSIPEVSKLLSEILNSYESDHEYAMKVYENAKERFCSPSTIRYFTDIICKG